MTDEQHDGWIRLALVISLIAAGVTLVLTGHEIGYWFFVGVVWILIGVL